MTDTATRQPRLVTIGETMALFAARTIGVPRSGDAYILDTGGSESNVAIGVQRLGHQTAWIGRVGADPFGQLVLGDLEGEGVDVSAVTVDPDATTGLMVAHQRTTDQRIVRYWRSGSAGARLTPDDVQERLIDAADCLHVSGITMAISESAREAALKALRMARDNTVVTSFDVNYRSALWSRQEASRVIRGLLGMVDIVFASQADAALVVDTHDPHAAAATIADLGPTEAIVTRGREGAVAVVAREEVEVGGNPVDVVDSTGAGDAFAAGYLSARFEGLPPAASVAFANNVASVAVRTSGDWRGLPFSHEIDQLTSGGETHLR